MKNIRFFLSENFQFLEVKLSIYLNRRVFVIFKCLPYMDMAVILFNGAEPFEQIVSILSAEGPM